MLELRLPSGGTVYVVGTCHVFPQSAAHVSDLVMRKKPVIVAVELCKQRLVAFSMLPPRSDHDYNEQLGKFRDALLEPNVFFMLCKLATIGIFPSAPIRSVYTVASLLFRSEPGAEFRAGVLAAKATGATVVTIDRDIGITMSRLYSELFVNALNALNALQVIRRTELTRRNEPKRSIPQLMGAFRGPVAVLDKLKAGSPVSEGEFATAVNEFVRIARSDAFASLFIEEVLDSEMGMQAYKEMPSAITTERDLLLARAIKKQVAGPGQSVVAVVGAGHLKGIAAHWASVDSPESADLASSYMAYPPIWQRVDLMFLAGLVSVPVWGVRRIYKAVRVWSMPKPPLTGAAPPRGWRRFRLGIAAVGVLGVCGTASVLYSRPRSSHLEKAPFDPIPEFRRLLRATTFRDPVTGEWCCRPQP